MVGKILFWALTSFHLIESVFTLRYAIRFRSFFARSTQRHEWSTDSWPKVALLIPFKGLDPGLRENIDSFFAQDYPDYKIFFISESEIDPAVPILKEYKHAQLFISGPAIDCGQKIHNLRFAIERIPEEFEVFAFVDSDCLLRPGWLRALVETLLQNPNGASTGYRWFLPAISDIAGNLRAVWNAGVFALFDEKGRYNFSWGGSMAITRKTFFSARVLDFWNGSVSDDLGLMNAIRSTGERIRFAPEAMPATAGKITFREFFSWASRQFLMARVYYSGLFRAAFIYHTAWVLWVVIGGIFYTHWFVPLFAVTCLSQIIKAELRLSCAQMIFPGCSVGHRAYHWLLSPIVAFCNFLMLFRLLFTRRVEWRGVVYYLLGPNDLKIKRRAEYIEKME